jgi:hypothetical protein
MNRNYLIPTAKINIVFQINILVGVQTLVWQTQDKS